MAASFARSVGRKKYDELIAIYTKALNAFLDGTHQKCSEVKTLLNQEVAVPLHQIYVNCALSYGEGASFNDQNVLQHLKDGPHHIAITGLAGSGKSMLMRWLAASLIESLPEHQRIPLFIEIRDLDLPEDNKYNLDQLIFDYCSSPVSKPTLEQFRIGLREGLFVILLDGVDEVAPEKISGFLRALSKFIDTYRKCALVASARPGTQLTHLPKLYVYRVEPLDLSRVTEILEKAPYDSRRKAILIKSLRSGLYRTHRSFLSNPLLVTITLITFDDASRIPDNLTGFYAAAFDALFTKHDWSKGVFTRKRYSGLEKSDFEKVLQYFCYQSYFRGSYMFSRDEVLNLIEQSSKLANVDVGAEDYFKDCVLSVCLLLVEEPRITFVHRSFQEFFTARFVAGYMGDKAPALLQWLASRSETDNTFVMASQLNRELVIRHWGLPRAREVRDQFAEWLKRDQPMKVLEFTGVDEVICELRTGDIVSFSGKHTPGAALLTAISSLIDARGSDAASPLICFTNAYAGKSFAELEPSLQRFLRGVLDDQQRAHLRVRAAVRSPPIEQFIQNLANGRFVAINQAVCDLEEFIRTRDEIADLVSLAQPSAASGNRKRGRGQRKEWT